MEIELNVLPDVEEAMIRDVVLLLLKKGVITCEELNACQKPPPPPGIIYYPGLGENTEGYMHAKEKEGENN